MPASIFRASLGFNKDCTVNHIHTKQFLTSRFNPAARLGKVRAHAEFNGYGTVVLPDGAQFADNRSDSREDRMAGLPHEQFSTPSTGARNDPEIALQWILNNVPCFRGSVPGEWTQAVYREASRWNIKLAIVRAALNMAKKDGYSFAEEPVHATPPGDIGSQWQARKAEFIAVASRENYLRSHQLFQIWQNLWMEQRALAAEDEDRIRHQIRRANPAVYADKMNLFELGKRDALGPDYQDAVDRLDTADFMLSAATELLGWLEAREAMGDHCTLQQATEQAIEIASAWSKFQAWFGLVVLAVLGIRGMSRSRAGRSPPQRRLPPASVPDPPPGGAKPRSAVPPIPKGVQSLQEFGISVMKWGNGAAGARARMKTLTRAELKRAGVTRDMAEQWRDFYRGEVERTGNPTAAGRVELMGRAAELLR